jgi:DNA-binding transcriptional regulator YdaS (Cro superfamily)
MLYVSEFADQVKTAIDSVVAESGVKNCNALARRLDVSKQALSKWRQTGIVPAHRALQMELMSQGQVSWKSLCPDIVADFNESSEVIYESSR